MNRLISPSRQIRRKSFHGQAITELLSVIPLMMLILSLVAVAGWWTYGRMNAISKSYFMTMQISTYNSLDRLSSRDKSFQPVTYGKAFWFDVQAYGSRNTFDLVFGLPAGTRVNFTFYVHGTIMTVDPEKVDPSHGGLQMFWDAPIRQKYGEPKSTLPGSFCWYCSSELPP